MEELTKALEFIAVWGPIVVTTAAAIVATLNGVWGQLRKPVEDTPWKWDDTLLQWLESAGTKTAAFLALLLKLLNLLALRKPK